MNTKVENSNENSSEFIIRFAKKGVTTENYPENSLEGLCLYIMHRTAEIYKEAPEKVTFPDGNEYIWGDVGSYLSHQFVGEGKINEQQFLKMLQEHNNSELTIVKTDISHKKELYKSAKQEYLIAEQNLQEKLSIMSEAFNNYTVARDASIQLKTKNNTHESKC